MTSENPETPHVLVVDDEPLIRQLIQDKITEDLKYRVTLAENGREALDRYQGDRPDVILSDIRMPGMDGLGLLREVKRMDPRMPFIMMSGQDDIEETIEALRNGAHDFFRKPLELGRLIRSLRWTLRQNEAEQFHEAIREFCTEQTRHYEIPNRVELVAPLIYEITALLEKDKVFSEVELGGVRAALHEMLVNGIEHGNLEITYEEKSRLMESPEGWQDEIWRRAQDPAHADRRVSLYIENTPQWVKFRITDEGAGFDHSNLPDPREMMHLLHGRGVLIARIHMDEVTYNTKGNEVTLVKHRKNSVDSI